MATFLPITRPPVLPDLDVGEKEEYRGWGRGGVSLTRKMERKYRDEGCQPLHADRLPRRLPTPFASVAFLVALMKGSSVIVLIYPSLLLSSCFLALFPFLSVSRSLWTNPMKHCRYERVNRIGRRTGARIPAQTFAHASNPLPPPVSESMKSLRVRLQRYIVCHNDIVFYRL